eukprot:CAMPEP_0119105192 /NCGR_PEP_ID=MMETSP1180-20130426/3228_1 /TAXON_ID=3052 ORGANISM="Chlamydomonas cf sp, Strain CCMP681" /NCGR_SAMPLE_ID=MMETSP1180 /ASSEMBLY_ACC=CAM_ASM_000741 /LENGTH=211 /DNA_ID=CAMNT_0007090193 /DNA_START=233 /DNA_END=869 /DNA_ORIENTATION=-
MGQQSQSSEVSNAGDLFVVDKRPVILYDGVCGMCNAAVNLMLDVDTAGNFRLAALQSPAGRRLLQRCGRRPEDISSIVLVSETGHWIRSDAVLRIAQKLPSAFPLLAIFGLPVPPFLRDWVYAKWQITDTGSWAREMCAAYLMLALRIASSSSEVKTEVRSRQRPAPPMYLVTALWHQTHVWVGRWACAPLSRVQALSRLPGCGWWAICKG